MGPLAGYKVIEMAAIGPAPFCGMMFSDMGADVFRIDRPQPADLGLKRGPHFELLLRGRRSVRLDLKRSEGVEAVLQLVERADALIEGFRPGVMERLGLGPEPCFGRNPRLVFGRITGWGQSGPLARAAGHDINYIALTGALNAIGTPDGKPVPPINLVGDFGGGALYLCVGVLAAMLEASRSGHGQVVDAAMIDGATSLLTSVFGFLAEGWWSEMRGTNAFDGGSHFYSVYETADGKFVAIGAIERRFYHQLLELVGLAEDEELRSKQLDREAWPRLKERLAAVFRTRTRDEWCQVLEGTDACFAPVLSLSEVPQHPHMVARQAFVDADGMVQPAPAPRFSRTPSTITGPPTAAGQGGDEALADWGFSADQIRQLRAKGAII